MASANYAGVSAGDSNTASADYAVVPGGRQAKADKHGQFAHAAGRFSQDGDAQRGFYVARGQTTAADPVELFLDGSNDQMTLVDGSIWTFEALVVARADGGDGAGYQVTGLVQRFSGTTSVLGLTTTVVHEDVAGWDVTAVADDTTDALEIQVTGSTATTIRWVASIQTVEVIGPAT